MTNYHRPISNPQPFKPLVAALALSLAACGPPAGSAKRAALAEPSPKAVTPPPGVKLEQTCVSTGPELCFDAIDNNCNGLLEEGCGVSSGIIQIAAAWEERDADVDLLVIDPHDEAVRPPKDGASAATPTSTGLLQDRDCPGSDNRCHGQNMENVFLEPEAEPTRGVYRVTVRLDKTNGARLPVVVHLGARLGPRVYGMRLELTAQGDEKAMSFQY